MTTVWDRRNPRISYQVPVGVLDPEARKVLNMISINVSRGGMFVDTQEHIEIGKVLVCNVPLGRDDDAIQLRGRVAWCRPNSVADERRPRGIGIEFIDLSQSDSERLESIVGVQQDQSHPVRLQIEGMGGAINAQARLTQHGIFFRSQLPFLKLESLVDFAFDDDDGAASYRGKIVAVDLQRDPGSDVPRLQVEVELVSVGHEDMDIPKSKGSAAVYDVMDIDRGDTEKTPAARALGHAVGDAAEDAIDDAIEDAIDDAIEDAIDDAIEEATHALQPNAVPVIELERKEPSFVAGRGKGFITLHQDEDDIDRDKAFRAHASKDAVVEHEIDEHTERLLSPTVDKRLWAASIAVAAAVLILLAWGLSSRGSDSSAASPALQQPDTSEEDRVRALIEGPADSEELSQEEAALDRIRAQALADADEFADAPETLATGGPKKARLAEPAEPALVRTDKAKPVAAPKAAPASKPSRESLGGVEIREKAGTLLISLPFEGELERAEEYFLADPPAFAVNLPYAKPKGGFQKSLEPKHESLRYIWVRERLGGLHFRVFFRGSLPDCKVELKSEEVQLRCQL